MNGLREFDDSRCPTRTWRQQSRRCGRSGSAQPAVKLAFEFLVLTATRPGETRMASWTEIDLDAGVWTIPAARMKANREHRIPLSPGAVEILDAAQLAASTIHVE